VSALPAIPVTARQPAARRRLRVVAAPRNTRRYVLLAIVVGALGVFGVVALNALAAEQAFVARALERELGDLEIRYTELAAEVAALEAPARVRAVAMTELGMVPAERPAFIALEPIPSPPAGPPVGQRRADEGVNDPIKAALGAGR
jgi:cell division protein FtsL